MVARMGLQVGSTMRNRMVMSLAPSIRADSSREGGTWAKLFFSTMTLKTLTQVGRIITATLSISPRLLMVR